MPDLPDKALPCQMWHARPVQSRPKARPGPGKLQFHSICALCQKDVYNAAKYEVTHDMVDVEGEKEAAREKAEADKLDNK